jgi:hypothetical protein
VRLYSLRCEVLTAMKVQVVICGVLTLCVVVGTLPQNNMASQPRRPRHECFRYSQDTVYKHATKRLHVITSCVTVNANSTKCPRFLNRLNMWISLGIMIILWKLFLKTCPGVTDRSGSKLVSTQTYNLWKRFVRLWFQTGSNRKPSWWRICT